MSKAEIIQDLGDDTFIIKFEDETTKMVTANELSQYYPCKCDGIIPDLSLDVLANGLDSTCFLPNYTTIKNI
jgi:hypothetical protein